MQLVMKSIQPIIKNITTLAIVITCVHTFVTALLIPYRATSYSNCITMASILNSQLCDLQHGCTFSKSYCEVVILLMLKA